MSKNTQSAKFRKVNVEDFDEDAYKEDEADSPSGNDDNFVAQKESEVKKLTQSYPSRWIETLYALCFFLNLSYRK